MHPVNPSDGSPSTYESCAPLWRQLSRCYRDSQCGGPANSDPPVAGKCEGGVCACPAPWAGAKCETLQRCMFHSDDFGGWTNQSCAVDVSQSTPDYFACRRVCLLGG